MDEGKKIYGKANLAEVVATIPPDPETEARHRAQILIKTDTIRVVVVSMVEGGELQEHTAPGPITIHSIEGTIEVNVEGESHILDAGELISLAPGVRHAVRCAKDGYFLLTIGVFLRDPDPGGNSTDTTTYDETFSE
ncbi:MAG TPA: cupin domain-containing protein [Thermomicrobiales bacterium]|nr:cupin domain-containing protein [Thermomicrobiales bacterium]